jgi:hypothetical protein
MAQIFEGLKHLDKMKGVGLGNVEVGTRPAASLPI